MCNFITQKFTQKKYIGFLKIKCRTTTTIRSIRYYLTHNGWTWWWISMTKTNLRQSTNEKSLNLEMKKSWNWSKQLCVFQFYYRTMMYIECGTEMKQELEVIIDGKQNIQVGTSKKVQDGNKPARAKRRLGTSKEGKSYSIIFLLHLQKKDFTSLINLLNCFKLQQSTLTQSTIIHNAIEQ